MTEQNEKKTRKPRAKKPVEPKSTLRLSKANKETKKYDESIMHEFANGELLKVYPYFRPSTIEKLLEELQVRLKHIHEANAQLKEMELYHFVLFLCVKYFTALKSDIEDKREKEDSARLIAQFRAFIDSTYYSELVNEVFVPSETAKVWDKVVQFLAATQLFEELGEQLQHKVADLKLKNADILKDISKLKIDEKLVQ